MIPGGIEINQFKTKIGDNHLRFCKQVNQLTCEIFNLFPLEPALTIDLKLLNSDKLFWALAPVLSRHSFKIRLTLFSNVWRREFPGVGSSWLLWACSMTSFTSFFDFLIVFWISWYVSLSAIQSSIPIKQKCFHMRIKSWMSCPVMYFPIISVKVSNLTTNSLLFIWYDNYFPWKLWTYDNFLMISVIWAF